MIDTRQERSKRVGGRAPASPPEFVLLGACVLRPLVHGAGVVVRIPRVVARPDARRRVLAHRLPRLRQTRMCLWLWRQISVMQ